MKSFEHVIDYVVAIFVLFLFPLIYFGLKQDLLTQTVVKMDTKQLVDDVRGKGYLTKEMFDHYLEKVGSTGVLYDIGLEHRERSYEPEYRFRTVDEIIEEQNKEFGGSNVYHFYPVLTNIPAVTDPVDNSGLTMNTETNESILATAVNTPPSPSHVHSDACYHGIKHIHTGSSTSGGGCYGSSTTQLRECGSTRAWLRHTNVYRCTVCNSSITGGSPEGMACWKNDGGVYTFAYVSSGWQCYGCNYTKPGENNPPCTEKISSTVYSLNCGKTEGAYYNGNTQVYPICGQQVVSIAATHPIQTVYINDPLITTVTATYADGSTRVVVGTTTCSTANSIQNQIVELTYSVVVEGVIIIKTCNIVISIIPKTKTCNNGHSYNLNYDGSDPGCIYCKSWLSSLVVLTPDSGSITIYRGTTLPENGVVLQATYMDGSVEQVSSTFIDNLDTNYIGTQNVTMSYKGMYVYLTVLTKRNQILCSICNRSYELYPDDTNPGCPHCASLTPIFTGKVMEYDNRSYTDEILQELYEGSGTYYFNSTDYLILSVKNKSRSWGNRLVRNLYSNLGKTSIHITYGGYIRESGEVNHGNK